MRTEMLCPLSACLLLAASLASGCGSTPDTGSIRWTWSIVQPPATTPYTCEAKQIVTVRLYVSGGIKPFDFPCTLRNKAGDYGGETAPFPSGSYAIQALAFANNGGQIQLAASMQFPGLQVIAGPTDLGKVSFIVQ